MATESTQLQITLDEQYPYVIAVACAIAFHCVMVGFWAGARRRTIFNSDFMKKHFEADHLKYLKAHAPKQGYPDCGNGVYSEKLEYKDWF